MLRMISATVLAVSALALTWSGLWPFACLVFLCAGVLAWEWAALRGRGSYSLPVIVQTAFTGIAIFLFAQENSLPGALTLMAGAGLAGLLAFRNSGSREAGLSALGVLYIGLPALALIFLRADPVYGFAAILFLFLVVWSEDTAAYVFGRLIGGPRLAPAISPGKTWAGFAAGLIVPAIAAFLFSQWLGEGAAFALSTAAILLALAAQLGDLCESAVKRAFDAKDSSALIPGHGGLFDRVDGLLFAAVLAALIACLRDPGNPGRALLIWP